ncbi:DnaT-like ssDNA-binding protein [Methylorubrum sp. POS3]|uniref:DnaT-like ssDNA-binding protein n=1 Tax=Methylorubrum sp. POS3 TaxID=2998492 RepID=UPI003729741A
MPLTIGANAYISASDADAYLSFKLHSNGWKAASEQDRERALIEATAALDRLGFSGSIARYDQPLGWPRLRMRDREGRSIPSNIVPQTVRDATCELALHLLTAPEPKPSPTISRKRVGDLELQYRATVPDPVPPIVRQLLSPFLAGSPHSVELVP